MTTDLLVALEQKVTSILEMVEFLRLQVETLEEENLSLKAEQERWRHMLRTLLTQFDRLEAELPCPSTLPIPELLESDV